MAFYYEKLAKNILFFTLFYRLVVLAAILGAVEFDEDKRCSTALRWQVLCYIVIMSVCVLIEAAIAGVSMRGTILDPRPRAAMQYLLYIRLGKYFHFGRVCQFFVTKYLSFPKCLHTMCFDLLCLGVFVIEIISLIIGVVWIARNYQSCDATTTKKALLGN